MRVVSIHREDDLGETVLVREDHELHAIAEAELAEHTADVSLHGRLTQEFRRGDLGITQAASREQEDLLLPARQGLVLGGSAARRRSKVLEQFSSGRCGDDRRARIDRANGRKQEFGIGVFEQKSARPRFDRSRGRLA